ncbi:MAG: DEAD/DEAH box helicase, partial [Desulfatiglandales bacterium]
KPSADRRLKSVFARIGIPEKGRFQPDPFQVKALSAIRHSDCLVSAPTGSGKTWIAIEAIETVHNNGGKSWYASPLKALTNSKYLELGARFGKENVGILTGDRVENPDAPIIVGTTEILRNQLYDAMYKGEDLSADLVILDEAHFLGDGDRGVVWEEIIIYLPVRIPLLLLSATIGNCHQIADWLQSLRGKKCVVIEERGRPVPLFPLFFHPTGRLLPLIDTKGLDRTVLNYLNNPKRPTLASGRRLPPFGEIINVLRKYNLLPAIFFLKSRADCDDALDVCKVTTRYNESHKGALNKRIDDLIKDSPHLSRHNQVTHLRNMAVAAHHSGQLPLWKLMIEVLMTEGLLDAVFATSTVAAGVNFPARSIVFLNSDRYNGYTFVPLTATELHQMTGRAGRRGMDNIGFAVVLPGRFMDVPLLATLLKSPPEDVLSQIRTDFSMALNLLLSHKPEEIKDILFRSFANYLNLKSRGKRTEDRLKQAGKRLMEFLPLPLCRSPESVLNLTRKGNSIRNEIRKIKEDEKRLETTLSKIANLVLGRLFLDKRSRLYCVIKRHTKRDADGVLACRLKYRSGRKKPPKTRFFAPEKVSAILDRVVDIQTPEEPSNLQGLLSKVSLNEIPPPLKGLPLGEEGISKVKPLKDRILFLEQELDQLMCNRCEHFAVCHGRHNRSFRPALKDFSNLWDSANAVRENLWADFMRHLNFLKAEGYVRDNGALTDDGKWASQLRIDQPLMIAEGLRLGLFPESDPALLAALIAAFVYDREIEVEFDQSKAPQELVNAYNKMKNGLLPLIQREAVQGFSVRPIPLWAAATIHAWAKGLEWDRVLKIADMTEGDLAMLTSRAADNLRQIASVSNVYPAIARTSTQAISLILREPVIYD